MPLFGENSNSIFGLEVFRNNLQFRGLYSSEQVSSGLILSGFHCCSAVDILPAWIHVGIFDKNPRIFFSF